jgi:site-specific recombinase XerD
MRSVDATPGAISTARYIKPNTVRSYVQYIRSLSLFFGALRLDAIHLGHLREYQMARLDGRAPFVRFRRPQDKKPTRVGSTMVPARGPSPCPAKAAQVNKELCLLKMILRRANAWNEQQDKFAEDLQTDEPEIPRALSPEEQTKWLEVSRLKERWNIVLWYSIVAFDTTCSTNELRGLRIGDVNLHHGLIDIPWPASKNKYRHRSIEIVNADALWAFQQLLQRARDLGAKDPQDYLFPFWDPKKNAYDPTRHMTVTGFKKQWDEVRVASGLKWFRRADTRHTGCTRLAENGVPVAVIMARSGHQSARMLQHYTHVSGAAQRRWLQRPLTQGPVAPRPEQPHLYAMPAPKEMAPTRPAERPGYTTIYVGGIPISIPA